MEQIRPQDIKRLSNLEDAGIRGGIHSKRTYLMALHDGSLWVWKQTGVEERDEIFMYHLARRMFRSIVPEVQPVFVPKLGWGSAMRKVAGVPAGRVDGLHGYFHGNEEMQADLVAMLVLDYLTGNPDRHANNWFIMHNDRLAAIDNGWAGEDPVMQLSEVFEPASLAGLIRDESLWPKMLQMMLELTQDLAGRGDEARALAEEIKIDRKEAVAMIRLWEPKLQRLERFIKSEASKLNKIKVYIEPGQQPPLGTHVEEGPRGGHYYESEGIPVATDKPKGWGTEEDPEEVAGWAKQHAAPQRESDHDAEPGEGVAAEPPEPGDLPALFDWVGDEITSGDPFREQAVLDYFAEVWSTDAADCTVREVEMRADDKSFEVKATLLDPETGEGIGSMDREFRADGEVHHSYFTLNRNVQGQGIALAVNKHAEDRYREMGFEYVSLSADIDIGKYAWAQQGYDFSDGNKRYEAERGLSEFMWEHGAYDRWAEEQQAKVEEGHDEDVAGAGVTRDNAIAAADADDEAAMAHVEEEYERELQFADDRRTNGLQEIREHANEPPDYWREDMAGELYFENAWGLASLDDGNPYGADEWPLGKAFMLSEYWRDWDAYKNLSPDSEGVHVGSAYYEKKKHKIKKRKQKGAAERGPGIEPTPAGQEGYNSFVAQQLFPLSERMRDEVIAPMRVKAKRAAQLRAAGDPAAARRILLDLHNRTQEVYNRYYAWGRQKIVDAGFEPRGPWMAQPPTPAPAAEHIPLKWREANLSPLVSEAAEKMRELQNETDKLVEERRAGGRNYGYEDIIARYWKLRHAIEADYQSDGRAMMEEAGYEPFGEYVQKAVLRKALRPERFPVELPAGSRVREGVSDAGAWDIDEDTDREWREEVRAIMAEREG